jgi:hypothetical protein
MVATAQRPRKALVIELDPVIGHVLRAEEGISSLKSFYPAVKAQAAEAFGPIGLIAAV